MPTKPTDIGTNRTGIATSPIDSERTIRGAKDGGPGMSSVHNGHALEVERVARSRGAGPVGTVPPPATIKGIIDKLGERIAFERTGTRLYEALLAKFEAAEIHEGGPTRAELEQIRDDEHRHVGILRDAMLKIGADPTAMTPCADVMGVAALGWIQVLTDPRTTLTQCLEVILIAELADGDGWMLLTSLADALGFDDLAKQFQASLLEEEQHLLRVRGWIAAALLGQAGVAPTPPQQSA
jgi:rubrerythrin